MNDTELSLRDMAFQTKGRKMDNVKKLNNFIRNEQKQTQWFESASELYRPSYRSFSAKLVPTFTDRRCHLASVTDSYGRILGFLDLSRYVFFQVARELYSRG
jgi:hypothetical protein